MSFCPYCMQELNLRNVEFLLSDAIKEFSFFKKYCRDAVPGEDEKYCYMQLRHDEKYSDFWGNRGKTLQNKFRVWANGEELIQFLARFSKMLKLEDTCEFDDKKCIAKKFKYDDDEVTFSLTEEETCRKLLITDNGNTVESQMICHHCHNIIPNGFFSAPQINIGFIAKQEAGKTCMLYSMIANNYTEINGSELLEFRPLQTTNSDAHYKEVLEGVEALQKGDCPGKTNSIFMPPIILEATWNTEEDQKPKAIVCLYDAAGELLEKRASQEASAVTDGKLNHIGNTDGWIFLIDPKDTVLQKYELNEKEEERIIGQAKVLDRDGQRKKQLNAKIHHSNSTVGDVMQKLLGRTSATTDLSNFFLNMCSYIEGKKKPQIAVVLSKSDEIFDNKLIKKYDKRNLFFTNDKREYLSKKSCSNDFERQKELEELFRELRIDIWSLARNVITDKNKIKLNIVSALGCGTQEGMEKVGKADIVKQKLNEELNPIRSGEPFVRLVMSLMEEIYCLDAESSYEECPLS